MTQALASFGGATSAGLPAPRGKPVLTRRQKAAIIVRILLREGAELKLSDLPDTLQFELTREMGALRMVGRETLHDVIDEFMAEVRGLGMTFPGGVAGALDLLDGALSPSCMRRLREEHGVPVSGDPWEVVSGLSSEALISVIQSESTEIAAVILSKLPVRRASELLGMLPGELARRITYAISTTGAVDPETVRTIGMAVAAQLMAEGPRAFDDAPVARVGAILNSSAAATRDDVLTGLDEEDQQFANEVRKAIFTFTNIPERIDPRDIPKVARAVDQTLLVTALAGAKGKDAEASEFVLSNMSQRLAAQLRDEMEEAGTVKTKDAEEAMSAVVAAIRDMESAGELTLLSGEDED